MTELVLKTENAFGFEKASIYLIIQTQPGSHLSHIIHRFTSISISKKLSYTCIFYRYVCI